MAAQEKKPKEKKSPRWQRRKLPKKERIKDTVPIPGPVLRHHLPDLTPAELKVYLYIATRSVGWGWDSEQIATSVIMEGVTKRDDTVIDRGTGLKERAVQGAIRSLLKRGLIWREFPSASKPPVYSVVSPEVRSTIFGEGEETPPDEDDGGEEESYGEDAEPDVEPETEPPSAQGGEKSSPPQTHQGMAAKCYPPGDKGWQQNATPQGDKGVAAKCAGGWQQNAPIERVVKKRNFTESDLVESNANGVLFENIESLPHIHSVDRSSPEKPVGNRNRETQTNEHRADDRPTEKIQDTNKLSKSSKSKGSEGEEEKPWRKFAATAEAVSEEELTDEHLRLASTWSERMGFGAGEEDVARIARVAYVCGAATFKAVAKKCADAHARKRVSHPWPLLCTAAASAVSARPSDALAARIKSTGKDDSASPQERYTPRPGSPRALLGGQGTRRKAKTTEEKLEQARRHGFVAG